jgi:ubiquinone/menaquinone biosynthesis C-methylase UbiE
LTADRSDDTALNYDRDTSIDMSPTLYVHEESYDTVERYLDYWYQIRHTRKAGGRVLEVGIGNGTVSAVLRRHGLEVVTVDLDRTLNPDVVADTRNLPFEEGAFHGAIACEVLEHVPWGDLVQALSELRRVVTRWVLLSVPSVGPALSVQARFPNAIHIVRMIVSRR